MKTIWVGILIFLGIYFLGKEVMKENSKSNDRVIDTLRVNFRGGKKIPDPCHLVNAGEWYFLYHISSGLISFNQATGGFDSLYASSWESLDENTHIFTLIDGARFHDGTPININDVEASIKRLLISKTSTHFPLWEYLSGCENLKKHSDECSGLSVVSENQLQFRFKKPVSSFYLQLASPETGIWHKGDINMRTNELTPTKFSGAYSVGHIEGERFELIRNPNWPLAQKFPDAPRKIISYNHDRENSYKAFNTREIDFFVDHYVPFGDRSWDNGKTKIHSSTPSTMTYFSANNLNGNNRIGRDLLEVLWSAEHKQNMVNADTFLPFGNEFTINKKIFLSQLPEKTAKRITVASPWDYYTDGFLNMIVEAGRKVGSEIQIEKLERDKYYELYQGKAPKEVIEKYDYKLAPYAASERYPAVQLRFITGPAKSTIDLKEAEKPSLGPKEKDILVNYQKWLLNTQLAIPIFLYPTEMVHRDWIDVGEQPKTDAEIELWRITKAEASQ